MTQSRVSKLRGRERGKERMIEEMDYLKRGREIEKEREKEREESYSKEGNTDETIGSGRS